MTTIAVFGPIIYIQDEAGQLFRDIALAVSSAVFLSLIVSITVIPTFASRILRVSRKKRNNKENNQGPPTKPRGVIGRFTYVVSGSFWLQLLLVAILTAAAVGMAVRLSPKAEYLPEGNLDIIFAMILPPPGYNLEKFEEMAEDFERQFQPYLEAEPGSPEAQALDAPPIQEMFFFARGTMAFMGVAPHDVDSQRIKELYPVVRRVLGSQPGIIPIVRQPSLFGRGVGAGRSINIEITGPELEKILEFGGQVFGQVRGLIPDAQARPIPGLDLGNPEVRVLPDRDRLAEAGLNVQDLGLMVDLLLDGFKASEFRYGGRNIDLTVMGEPGRLARTQDLADVPLRTPGGDLVTLGSVSMVKTVSGPVQINHIERQRSVTIQVIPPETLPLQTAMEMIEEKVAQPLRESGRLGEFYHIRLAGTADKLTQTREALSFNFILALVITYLLMAALFESFIYPLVIMFTVPLAAAGGFLGLALVNRFLAYQPLDVLTMLGFVILIGIVVNNAILIVHQALNNIRFGGHGHPPGRVRIGPNAHPAHLHEHAHQRLRHEPPGPVPRGRVRAVPRPGQRGHRRTGGFHPVHRVSGPSRVFHGPPGSKLAGPRPQTHESDLTDGTSKKLPPAGFPGSAQASGKPGRTGLTGKARDVSVIADPAGAEGTARPETETLVAQKPRR